LPSKAKKAAVEAHRRLQREKDEKRKQKKNISLPPKHLKGKN
jgi:hypothetical protein